MKTYGTIRIFCICIVGIYLNSCSPQYRLQRLLENHQYLYENFRYDSIRIQNAVVQDSLFFFTKEKDTLYFNNATIYRNADTLRLVQSCPPCTTTITKQILQPTKEYFKEKRYERSLREKLEDAVFPFVIGMLVCALIIKK